MALASAALVTEEGRPGSWPQRDRGTNGRPRGETFQEVTLPRGAWKEKRILCFLAFKKIRWKKKGAERVGSLKPGQRRRDRFFDRITICAGP